MVFALLGLALGSLPPAPPTQTIDPCASGSPLAGGLHVRRVTSQGPVHLWCPPARALGSDDAQGTGEGAGTRALDVVVYVHGYWDDVDSAFADHHLAEQFAASGVRAAFIAVSAPSGPGQPVRVTDLDALLAELLARDGVPAGIGRVLVVGHSGAYRTIWRWLASERLRELVLLDAFYGATEPLERWLRRPGGAQLWVVSRSTLPKARAWLETLTTPLRSRVRHDVATCSHGAIVTDGAWLGRVVRDARSAGALARW